MTNDDNRMQHCARKCWMLAAIGGVVLAILLLAFGGWSFFGSILAGLVVFGVGGFLLKSVQCGNPDVAAPEAAAQPAAASSPAPAAEASSPAPAAEAAPEADMAPAVATKAAADAKVLVKPSAPLAGQQELAARKGSWKYEKPAEEPAAKPAAKQAAKKAPAKKAAANKDADTSTTRAPVAADGKPEMLDAPRDGQADDLKQIKGVGPKLEALLNEIGIYHFSQVAGWRKKEVAWADQNLVGFKGRVSRDEWVKQAKVLAKGGSTEFSNKVKKGGVY